MVRLGGGASYQAAAWLRRSTGDGQPDASRLALAPLVESGRQRWPAGEGEASKTMQYAVSSVNINSTDGSSGRFALQRPPPAAWATDGVDGVPSLQSLCLAWLAGTKLPLFDAIAPCHSN